MSLKIALPEFNKAWECQEPEKKTLLQIILEEVQHYPHGCTHGTCGACLSFVLEGRDLLESPDELESARLKRFEAEGSDTRLLCRAKIVPGARGLIKVRPC